MGKKGRKEKVAIKELPAKVKIIRQISGKEVDSNQPLSGLEKKEQEVERELSIDSLPSSTPNANFLMRSNVPPQQMPRTTGNTAVQQRPQEDSDEVKRWYAQSARLASGSDERRYQLSENRTNISSQNTLLNQGGIGKNQELQNLQGNSISNEEKYNLKTPEKKESRRRYPWEV